MKLEIKNQSLNDLEKIILKFSNNYSYNIYNEIKSIVNET